MITPHYARHVYSKPEDFRKTYKKEKNSKPSRGWPQKHGMHEQRKHPASADSLMQYPSVMCIKKEMSEAETEQ